MGRGRRSQLEEERDSLNPEEKIKLKPKFSYVISPGPPGYSIALIFWMSTMFTCSVLITAQAFMLHGPGYHFLHGND